ncbi:MAG: peroxiredoxin [Myxococcota bacterium]|nr:peroxiredoxin [Myxococcota bacterium]
MTIQIGERIPEATLTRMSEGGPTPVKTSELFAGKKVVLFGVPGAFTPTCSARHLPGYLERHPDFVAKGIDTVACVSVNDAFVMGAWGKDQEVDGKVLMLADGNAELTKKLGLERDSSAHGMGTRSQRYALYAEDGVVKALEIEPGPGLNVSSAEALLTKIG